MDRTKVVILGIIIFVPLLLLEGRLVFLQVVKAGTYREQIQQIRSGIEVIPSSRGRIYDRKGRILALDDRAFDLYVMLEDFEPNPEVSRLLEKHGIERETIEAGVARIKREIFERHVRHRPVGEEKKIVKRERQQPYLLVSDIPFETAYQIELHPEIYKGLDVQPRLRRTYPNGATAAHLLGYLGKRNEQEVRALTRDEEYTRDLAEGLGEAGMELLASRGVFMDELIGREGVERYYDGLLRGRIGITRVERRPGVAQKIRIGVVDARSGKDLRLTIDLDLQKAAEEALQDVRGSAVVMDVRDGSILALASRKTFEPNKLVPPVRREVYREYEQDRTGKPLFHRAVSGEYPIGSIFKIVTAMAALEEKAITPQTQFNCTGRFSESMEHFKCWILARYNSSHGELTLEHAIERSCNVYFYNAGKKAGPEAIARWASACGLGKKSGIDLPGEQDGIVPTEEWRRTRRAPWTLADTLSLSIGQGLITATPLQATRMVAIVANGGKPVVPHLNQEFHAPELPSIGISQQTLDEIRKGLKAVVHGEHGTARGLSSWDIVGKTSTAESGREEQSHAWFAAYYPVENPRVAVLVMIEHGGGGGAVAAPRTEKILQKLKELDEKQNPQ